MNLRPGYAVRRCCRGILYDRYIYCIYILYTVQKWSVDSRSVWIDSVAWPWGQNRRASPCAYIINKGRAKKPAIPERFICKCSTIYCVGTLCLCFDRFENHPESTNDSPHPRILTTPESCLGGGWSWVDRFLFEKWPYTYGQFIWKGKKKKRARA